MKNTPISPEELESAKNYMRVDGDEEDEIVYALVQAARVYLANAGIDPPAPQSPQRRLYDLAVWSLALGYYERRDPASGAGENPALRQIINQLKLTEKGEDHGDASGGA